ncbi:purine and uridine phosphorylase [Cenococcum geophilum]
MWPGLWRRPIHSRDFEIAIICALPLEAHADDGYSYTKAPRDPNAYSTGVIGRHNVVLAHMPDMGKANAATSFEGIKLALVVGEILLGDVIISTGIIQYDFGRQFPDGFIKKEKPNTEIRAHLAKLESGWDRRRLQDKTSEYLTTADYPGAGEDRLFKPAYRHKHQNASSCATCAACQQRTDPDLGCDSEKQLPRRRLEAARLQNPMVHFGLIASGDKVIKCGEIRDAISERNGGAGVWDNVPCVVIKGNKKWQNYAAATAAACMKAFLEIWTPTVNPERNEQRGFMAKLVLFFCLMTVLLIIQTAYHKWDSWLPVTQNLREEGLDATQISSTESYWTVPFGRNKDFVGRGSELVRLVEELRPGLPEDDCQRIALVGLGGVGKTQIALEASFRIREQCPDCSVFWVPATDTTSFEGAYRDIGRKLQVEGIEGDKADVKLLVKAALSQERAGKWLLVVDNADDMELLYGEAKATNGHNTTALARYLPFNRKGSILFTTRNRKAAVKLAGKNLVSVDAMSRPDALKLLETSLAEKRMMMRNTESTTQLLDLLANLPLAIRQASAYMNENQMSTTTYLEIYRSDDDDMIHLLSQDFEDLGRYENVKNPIAMTWLVSFREILRHDPLAADYLRFMCFLAEQDIPQSLLAPAPKAKMVEAIGTLKAYAFLTEREDVGSYDIHRLVQVSVRSWLKERGEWNVWITKALQQLANEFPFPIHENRNVWVRYLPHAQYILELRERSDNEQAERDLLFKVGCSYRIIGKYKESEIIYRQTLELKKKVLGREHPDTLNSMNNLAVVLGNQGKYEEAEQIFRQTLELKEKVLGREHPDTLISMNNLAGELGSQGKCIGRRSS